MHQRADILRSLLITHALDDSKSLLVDEDEAQSSGVSHNHGFVNVNDGADFDDEGRILFGRATEHLDRRPDLMRSLRAPAEAIHDVVFAVRQKNLDEVKTILEDVSDPFSPNYGQHLTREEVADLTSNPEARDSVVAYLTTEVGATIVQESAYGEYIMARASVSVWEKLFDTEFYTYKQTEINSDSSTAGHEQKVKDVYLATHYSLPRHLAANIHTVLNTVQLPSLAFRKKPTKKSKADATLLKSELETNGSIAKDIAKSPQPQQIISSRIHLLHINESSTKPSDAASWSPQAAAALMGISPQVINSLYGITSNIGSAAATQGVYGSLSQFYRLSDLYAFQDLFNLPRQDVATTIGTTSSTTNGGSESSLDLEYLMAISQTSPTTYWYSSDWMMGWIFKVASATAPPKVLSISYGSPEPHKDHMDIFNIEAMKLGLQGVTLVASSGDDGAIGSMDSTTSTNLDTARLCGYSVAFPASSPYVTSVGATQVYDQTHTDKRTCIRTH
jgi:tripeptidyl-peptidase-1